MTSRAALEHGEPPRERWPIAPIGSVGRSTIELAAGVGAATLFLARALLAAARPPFRARLVLEQLHFVGNRSILIVVLTSAFTGLVLTLQGHTALARFGATRMLGALVSLSLVRELAPVLAALMIAARAGSAIAATLGNMRVTEQIDALETMAIDPLSYTVVPPLLSSIVAVPLLTAVFTVSGLAVSHVFAVQVLGIEAGQYAASIKDAIETSDVAEALWKSLTFAVLIAWIATYRGFFARGGAKGVGQATTRAVVETSVLVLAADYVLTALFF